MIHIRFIKQVDEVVLHENPLIFGEGSTKKFELMFKASVHGYNGLEMHKRCDKLGKPTICFILSEHGKVFGGYVSIDWDQSHLERDANFNRGGLSGCRNDWNAFIFSLTHNTKHLQFQHHHFD